MPQELLVAGNAPRSLVVLELRELLLFERWRRLALALVLRKRLSPADQLANALATS